MVPKPSTLSALLQVDLAQTTTRTATTQHLTNATNNANTSLGDPSILNSLYIIPNLGIEVARTHIYVISLPDRHDRRDQMAFLQTIQGPTWTVVDAVPRNATLVDRTLDWVTVHRAEHSRNAQAGAPCFRWPEEIDALSVSPEPLCKSGSDRWAEASPSSKPKPASKVGLSMYSTLPCATEDNSIPAFTNDVPEWTLLSPARIVCWHSHVLAIRQFVDIRFM